jgi:prepilin-type N-terminal cleavage/methylation domain-containing protein
MKKITPKGFTLIELAVALTIVALVIGGLAVPMSKRLAEQQYIDTQANIDKALEALIGYAISNRRLPCPDVNYAALGSPDNRDGFEDVMPLPVAGVQGSITGCSIGIPGTLQTTTNYHSDNDGVSWGDLPWQTLGLAPPNNVDAWNNRLRYAVFTPLVTQTPNAAVTCSNTALIPGAGIQALGCVTTPVGAPSAAQIDVRCSRLVPTTAALGCLSTTAPPYSVTTNAVLVVYSMGSNQLGSTSIVNLNSTAAMAFNATQQAQFPDQIINAPELKSALTIPLVTIARRQFVARARTDASSNSGEFDDVVSFISSSSFAARLSTAGVWP